MCKDQKIQQYLRLGTNYYLACMKLNFNCFEILLIAQSLHSTV